MSAPSLFPALASAPWWAPLEAASGGGASAHGLAIALAASGHESPAAAVAYTLLAEPSVLGRHAGGRLPGGLEALLGAELARLSEVVGGVSAGAPEGVPLSDLAGSHLDPSAAKRVARLATALRGADHGALVGTYLDLLREVGNGPAALYPVTTWRNGRLEPVRHPDVPDWSELVGVEGPLRRLAASTEALLAGRRANDCLLYGARGSGKSTAVRGLVRRYAERGLRLVELPPTSLEELPELIETLRPQPLKFVLFVDDLAFEADDARYRPLKSLLDGGVRLRPHNAVVYATSNRRHLVRERMRDRPDPLDDDVHAWDTQHERLALADRFGLVITFPAADQRSYLEVVRALATGRGLRCADGELEERALRFAEWNNGYSGRTARQFVDTLVGGG